MPIFKRKVYIKDERFDPIYNAVNLDFYVRSRILPGIFTSLGILILGTQVIIPLIFFKTHEKVTPEVASSVLGIATGFNEFEFRELTPIQKDLTETNEIKEVIANIPKYFYVTVPKLGIKNAVVETNSKELSPKDRLGHYNNSAIPGTQGNAFIYGHSVLPWFYNPKNYKTIFSTLDKLKTGDEIIVSFNNVEYTYKIEYSEIQKPQDVNPLGEYKPPYLNAKTLTLMTCWPAGTKSKRYMVRAIMSE
jgi:LPXTG-site transpeptidase (sortase) family protein